MKSKWIGSVLCVGVFFSSTALSVAVAGPAEDTIGQQAVNSIRSRYYDTRMNCGKPNIPGPVCNGVIFRSTTPSTAFKFWDPSPPSKAKGGFSASYARADVKFDRMLGHNNNGYIIYPPIGNPPEKKDVNMLCLFPDDGWTYARDKQGCGVSANSGPVSESCELQNIKTGAQWFAKHQADGYDNQKQCSFNIRDGLGAVATSAFEAFVQATNLNIAQGFDQQNEMMLGISDPGAPSNPVHWDSSEPATLPIQAIFYVPGNNDAQGLADAQYDQQDYCKATGLFLPIITMTLPTTPQADFAFNYKPADQIACVAQAPVGTYIEKGEWISRFDPGTGKDEWSLQLTPTKLGREVRDDATTVLVYAEMVKLFGNDPQWKAGGGASMREQLICHYLDARNKPQWNLEAWRPASTTANSRKYGCNHLQ